MIKGVFKKNNYGFFTDNIENFTNNLPHKWMVYQRQMHSNILNVIEKYDNHNECIIGDGLLTSVPYLQLVILTADCLPLIICGNNICGVLHLGWKSLHLGLLEKTINILKNLGEQDCQFIIGPTILEDNFPVSEDVINLFKSHKNFDIYYKNSFNKNNSNTTFSLTRSVVNVLHHNCYNNIIDTKIDTYTNSTWHSHRRDADPFYRNINYVFRE